jgi:serine/threonine protein kinase
VDDAAAPVPDAGWERAGQDAVPNVPGYELVGVLGAGAGGRVWRARPGATPVGVPAHDVALKIVRGGDRAERELAVLRGVRHEHVVRLRDSVPLPDGSLALVLDLVDGGTLAQLVAARGHLRPGEVVTVVAPLAATLAELHAAGIQHGDIAPGNVLFDASGRPMLGDLGTVRITGEAREEQFGTPGYVDPVVVAGGLAGPASDVYGLAALALALIHI